MAFQWPTSAEFARQTGPCPNRQLQRSRKFPRPAGTEARFGFGPIGGEQPGTAAPRTETKGVARSRRSEKELEAGVGIERAYAALHAAMTTGRNHARAVVRRTRVVASVGGAWRSRTALDGFAIRCITALLTRRRITLLRHSTAKSRRPLHDPSATPLRGGRTPLRRTPETKRESQVSGSPSKIWSGKGVSNSRPQPWQGCALPTELFPRNRRAL